MTTNAFFFFSVLICGLVLEIVFGRLYHHITKNHYKEHHFSYGKYLFYLTFPLFAVIGGMLFGGQGYIAAFVVTAVAGMLTEYFIGWSYHRIVGERLWTYHRFSLNSYTSVLSMPLWGVAGVASLVLGKDIPVAQSSKRELI